MTPNLSKARSKEPGFHGLGIFIAHHEAVRVEVALQHRLQVTGKKKETAQKGAAFELVRARCEMGERVALGQVEIDGGCLVQNHAIGCDQGGDIARRDLSRGTPAERCACSTMSTSRSSYAMSPSAMTISTMNARVKRPPYKTYTVGPRFDAGSAKDVFGNQKITRVGVG